MESTTHKKNRIINLLRAKNKIVFDVEKFGRKFGNEIYEKNELSKNDFYS